MTTGLAFVTFISPTETRPNSCVPSSARSAPPLTLAGVQPSLPCRTRKPLMGFSKCPSIDIRTRCPLPASARSKNRSSAFGTEPPRSALVPSMPFLPATTACSTRYAAGLLHPAADHGVRQVSGSSLRAAAVSLRCSPLPGDPKAALHRASVPTRSKRPHVQCALPQSRRTAFTNVGRASSPVPQRFGAIATSLPRPPFNRARPASARKLPRPRGDRTAAVFRLGSGISRTFPKEDSRVPRHGLHLHEPEGSREFRSMRWASARSGELALAPCGVPADLDHSRWRTTLRSFSLPSSRTASPRSMPSRR